jgi:hypothetical protein
VPYYLKYFKIILFLWKFGLVDNLTMAHVFMNTAAQYASIAMGTVAMSGNFDHIRPHLLLSPFSGLLIGSKFIAAGIDFHQKRQRAATLPVLVWSSIAIITTTDTATNIAQRATDAAMISHMKESLKDSAINITEGGPMGAMLGFIKQTLKLRGGSQAISKDFLISSLKDFQIIIIDDRRKNPVLSPAQVQFQQNSKLIIRNMFYENNARRYLQRAGQKFKIVKYGPSSMTPIAILTQFKTISCTYLKLGLVGFTIFISLYLALYVFQRAECKRYQKNQIIIDV